MKKMNYFAAGLNSSTNFFGNDTNTSESRKKTAIELLQTLFPNCNVAEVLPLKQGEYKSHLNNYVITSKERTHFIAIGASLKTRNQFICISLQILARTLQHGDGYSAATIGYRNLFLPPVLKVDTFVDTYELGVQVDANKSEVLMNLETDEHLKSAIQWAADFMPQFQKLATIYDFYNVGLGKVAEAEKADFEQLGQLGFKYNPNFRFYSLGNTQNTIKLNDPDGDTYGEKKYSYVTQSAECDITPEQFEAMVAAFKILCVISKRRKNHSTEFIQHATELMKQ